MNRLLFIVTAYMSSIILGGAVYGGWKASFNSLTNGNATQVVNRELCEELAETDGRYQFSQPFLPTISASGLTFDIGGCVSVKNIKVASVEEAEKICIDVYRDYIDRANSVRIIRPFLMEFPITPSIVSLAVNFEDEKGNFFDPPCIAAVAIQYGETIEFFQFVSGRLTTILKKNLSEVEELKRLFLVGVKRQNGRNGPVFPDVCSIERALPSVKVFFDFVKDIGRKNHLEYVTRCIGTSYKDRRPFECVLRGIESLNLEQARKLTASCAKRILAFLQTNKETISYIKERKKWPKELFPRDFPETCHIAFRISFWDEYGDRQPQPYIAEVRVAGESFKYYTANEGQFLVLAYEESWDDAMKFLEKEEQSRGEPA